MVGFGTGKYLENGDPQDTSIQTLYGIWDDQSGGGTSAVTGRGALVAQEVLGVANVSGVDYRVTTDNPVDFTQKRGWFMDLPDVGERVAFNPIVRPRRFVFVTLVPSQDPCTAGGQGWLMELDYLTGSRLEQSPFDVDGDGAILESDKLEQYTTAEGATVSNVTIAASGRRPGVGIPTTPTVLSRDERTEVKLVTGSAGGIEAFVEGKSMRTGRISWRQLLED
jgi:type IV pilus assembly protein PilY1